MEDKKNTVQRIHVEIVKAWPKTLSSCKDDLHDNILLFPKNDPSWETLPFNYADLEG